MSIIQQLNDYTDNSSSDNVAITTTGHILNTK